MAHETPAARDAVTRIDAVRGCADLMRAKRVAQHVVRALRDATGTGLQHLECRTESAGESPQTPASASASASTSAVTTSRGAESRPLPGPAALSAAFAFGPAREMQALGAELPASLSDWRCFETIRGEVSVQPDWTELDARAEQWARAPSVKYVLCIRIAPQAHVSSSSYGVRANRGNASVAEYKLHAVNHDPGVAVVPPMPPVSAMPIDSPATFASFDAHHALGLSPIAALPEGFASPITLDLFAAVHGALETTLRSAS